MKPFIGKVVHFNEIMQKHPWPAIVIAMKDDDDSKAKGVVDLHVFSTISGGVHIARGIPFSEKPKEKEQTWSEIPQHREEKPSVAQTQNHKGK